MKIRNQLFLIFLSLGVTVTLMISFLIYIRGKRIILEQVHSNLEAVSKTKKTRLESMIRNRFEMLELMTTAPFFVTHIDKRLLVKEGETSGKEFSDSLISAYAKSIPDIVRIYITNTEGKVISSSDSTFLNRDLSGEELFISIQKKGKYLDGFFYSPKGDLCYTEGIEIKDLSTGRKLGNLYIDQKADDFISLTNDYTGLGTTGETVIAKMYQQPTLLTPTRFNPDAGLKVKIPKNDPKYAINIALEGKEGIFENMLDYRDVSVIASPRFIEDAGWAIVTKMDKEEAYKSIDRLRNYLLLLNLGVVLLALIISYFIGWYLAKPVEELIRSIRDTASEQRNTKVRYAYNNELTTIAESFNGMADKLERKLNEFDKISYVISHDLKAPLNSIIPLVDFIKEDNKEKLSEETEKMLNMIKVKSLQMNALIKEISEKTKSDKKIKENVDVDALVSTIISNLNPDHSIQFFIQHNLPLVQFHKISLMQVFQNLIHNSIKYMDKEKGIVNIGYADEKEDYKFWVTDNGPGMKTENFGLSETGTDTTGIGLGVSRNIIENNGGKIWVESALGEGTTFYFTIPKL